MLIQPGEPVPDEMQRPMMLALSEVCSRLRLQNPRLTFAIDVVEGVVYWIDEEHWQAISMAAWVDGTNTVWLYQTAGEIVRPIGRDWRSSFGAPRPAAQQEAPV